ncbi:MAG: hypothetical protein WBX25_10655 [Rhodomicrobium sp.]
MQQKNAESIEEAEGEVMTKLISVAATALLVVVTSASAKSLPSQRALRYPAAPSYYLAPGASVYHGYSFGQSTSSDFDPFHFPPH